MLNKKKNFYEKNQKKSSFKRKLNNTNFLLNQQKKLRINKKTLYYLSSQTTLFINLFKTLLDSKTSISPKSLQDFSTTF